MKESKKPIPDEFIDVEENTITHLKFVRKFCDNEGKI